MTKNTVFRQVLQFLPRYDFENIEKRHHQGRKRKMDPWTQCLSLIFGQLLGCVSLRHIADNLNSHPEKYYHHGMHTVSKSSLSRAMGDFSYKIYAELFQFLLARCKKLAPGHQFKFKNTLYLIDSTTITLCYQLFNWASYKQGKGGIKIHTQLDASGQLPVFISISAAKSHDSQSARLMRLKKDDIVAFDRGYYCFKWFKFLDTKGVTFVTRTKSNMQYKVIERHKTLLKKNIRSDQTITLTGDKGKNASEKLRRICYYDRGSKKYYIFLTNNFKLAASTIATIYKERWVIEVFFRDIKQNLKIKTFVSTSENAVKSQIYIALCTYLLLKLIAFTNQLNLSIGKIRRLIAIALFSTKGLLDILTGEPPKTPIAIDQLSLQIM